MFATFIEQPEGTPKGKLGSPIVIVGAESQPFNSTPPTTNRNASMNLIIVYFVVSTARTMVVFEKWT